MDSKEKIHGHLEAAAMELLHFIKQAEGSYRDGWVPAADIKQKLGLNMVAVPVANKVDRGEKGWMFATLARLLEDKKLVQYQKRGSRAYYRAA